MWSESGGVEHSAGDGEECVQAGEHKVEYCTAEVVDRMLCEDPRRNNQLSNQPMFVLSIGCLRQLFVEMIE